MKAITFLGVEPKSALYTMGEMEHEASFFGAALARFNRDLDLRVLVTERALANYYPAFEQEVKCCVAAVRAVPIPDGKDASELWQLFECVVDQIDENEEVIFDITHAFRSLPFLSFLAAAYVRTVKRATIKRVYYANFAAKYGEPARTPVIDLTEFVSLLDWMVAADLFSSRGDSSRLAVLMRSPTPDAHLLPGVATSMQALSKSLRLIRPDEVMRGSADLIGRLQDGAGEIAKTARPFVPLLHQVADAYRPLALPNPGMDPIAALAIERDLVDWYVKRGYLVQAAAVAREWLVTWALLQSDAKGRKKLNKRYHREQMETAITGQQEQFRDNPRPSIYDISNQTYCRQLVDLYSRLSEVRNDLLHAGKRESPKTAEDVETEVRHLCAQLAEFSLPGEQPPAP